MEIAIDNFEAYASSSVMGMPMYVDGRLKVTGTGTNKQEALKLRKALALISV